MLPTRSDSELWQAVVAGDTPAFESIVERYQGIVSAIAYSRLGSLEASQDVAQETFWVAWSNRAQLRDPERLPAWLCGIARNLSHQQYRRVDHFSCATSADSLTTREAEPGPLEQSIHAEQAAIVWQAVQQLPEHYRDVMVLYYREEHSVHQVASALELSEDAVKQRLSRGRAMLREELASVVEVTLASTRPSRSFTAKVMSGLVAMGVAAQTAKAAAAGTGAISAAGAAGGALLGKAATGAAMSATSSVLLGLLGGLLGGLGGLGGAWLGTYLPAELAPSETERQLLKRRGRVMFRITLVFTLLIAAYVAIFTFWLKNIWLYVVFFTISMIGFMIIMIVKSRQLHKEVMALRERINPDDDPNRSALRQRYPLRASMMRGRKYTSKLRLAGLPLLDIQFADQMAGTPVKRCTARGWIAIGDCAIGGLAMGGVGIGVISFGGLAIGGLAIGGGAFGLFSLGGLAVGGIAMGGGAIGVQAAGGAAIALHSAFGGLAIAWHLAGGGLALAHDIAAGGGGAARIFNTPEAKAAAEAFWMASVLEVARSPFFMPVVMALGAIPMWLSRFCYEKAHNEPKAA